jgi:predicted nucleic acid-binding Zn ribbon protein
MPEYTYQVIHKDGSEGEMFEVIHRMSDPALTEHPETGEKVVRVFSPPNVADSTSNHERVQKQRLSDKNLDRLGFTKYQRNGKGHYERTAGNFGPETLNPGP